MIIRNTKTGDLITVDGVDWVEVLDQPPPPTDPWQDCTAGCDWEDDGLHDRSAGNDVLAFKPVATYRLVAKAKAEIGDGLYFRVERKT